MSDTNKKFDNNKHIITDKNNNTDTHKSNQLQNGQEATVSQEVSFFDFLFYCLDMRISKMRMFILP